MSLARGSSASPICLVAAFRGRYHTLMPTSTIVGIRNTTRTHVSLLNREHPNDNVNITAKTTVKVNGIWVPWCDNEDQWHQGKHIDFQFSNADGGGHMQLTIWQSTMPDGDHIRSNNNFDSSHPRARGVGAFSGGNKFVILEELPKFFPVPGSLLVQQFLYGLAFISV